MRKRLLHAPPLIAALGAATLIAAVAVAFAQTESSIQLIAMDADPAGNTATSLGHLDPCVRTVPGSDVAVDLVVDSVPDDRPFLGFQVEVSYDADLLTVTDFDTGYLLGANGVFEPFDALSDPLPDRDGAFTIIVADLASVPPDENMESGEGVLSRVTFSAKKNGMSLVAPGFDVPDVYPALVDGANEVIEVRTIAGIRVAIGEDCPPGLTEIEPTELPSLPSLAATSTPTPTPDPSPSPTPTGSVSSTSSARPTHTPGAVSLTPTVLPAAFPATGGQADGSNADMLEMAAGVAFGLAAVGALVWVRRVRAEG